MEQANLFDAYSNDLKTILSSVETKINDEAGTLKGEAKKSVLRKAEMELEEAEEILSQMQVELLSIPASLRGPYSTSLKSSKSSLDKLKKSLKESSSRAALLSSSNGDPYSDSPDAEAGSYSSRTRLLKGTDTLADGSRRIQESHRLALETEDLGAEVLGNLRGQREQIERSRDLLYRADNSIDKASGTLKKMITKMYQQKFITYAIIVILVLLIGVVIWGKLRG